MINRATTGTPIKVDCETLVRNATKNIINSVENAGIVENWLV